MLSHKECVQKIIDDLHNNKTEIMDLYRKVSDEWSYDDGLYRYYHQSFKVFQLQSLTVAMKDLFEKIVLTKLGLNMLYYEIFYKGTGFSFDLSFNDNWHKHAGPIVEAFLHSKFFLEMIVKTLEVTTVPSILPSHLAAVLELYNSR